jgi:dipeptidyl aminopeptidase/acylaminoacyl peptidase
VRKQLACKTGIRAGSLVRELWHAEAWDYFAPRDAFFFLIAARAAGRKRKPMLRHLAPLLLAASLVHAAELPSNLTAENLPPITPETRASAGRYLESRTAVFHGWLPGTREMLVTTRFADTAQVHHVKMPGGARRQLTFGREPIGGLVVQPKIGKAFVFSQDSGGGEAYQLHRFDFADGRSTLLTDGKSRNTSARWSRDGKQLAYTTTRRNGKDNDVHIMDPFAPETDRAVFQVASGGWSVKSWSHDGKKLLLGEYLSINESRLHLLDIASGKAELLTPPGAEKESWAEATFGPDDTFVWALTDRGSEFMRLVRLDFATKEVRVLVKDIPWNIEDFALTADGQRMAIVSNEDGASVLRIIDPQTGAIITQPKLPLGVMGAVSWNANGHEVAFSLNSAKSPTDAWSYDLATAQLTRWTESEIGGLDPAQFSEPEIVRVKSFDGLGVSGFLYRPDAKRWPGKRPCLVNIHGGPEGQSLPVFQGRHNYYLNELGIAIFYPNVRGSDGYGKTFLTLDNGFKREDSVKDIGAFLDALAKDERLDAARFAVTGGSYGGYMSTASMVHFGDRLRCGIDVVGVADFLTFLANTSAYRLDLRRVEYGDERDPKMREFLVKISPSTHAAEIRKPLFIVQGKNDPRVPVSVAHSMRDAMKKAGGTVSYLEASDEGHGFAKKPNADFQFLAAVEFLRENLLK